MNLELIHAQLAKAETHIESINHNAHQLSEIAEKLPVKTYLQIKIREVLKEYTNTLLADSISLNDLVSDLQLANCEADLELMLADFGSD